MTGTAIDGRAEDHVPDPYRYYATIRTEFNRRIGLGQLGQCNETVGEPLEEVADIMMVGIHRAESRCPSSGYYRRHPMFPDLRQDYTLALGEQAHAAGDDTRDWLPDGSWLTHFPDQDGKPGNVDITPFMEMPSGAESRQAASFHP